MTHVSRETLPLPGLPEGELVLVGRVGGQVLPVRIEGQGRDGGLHTLHTTVSTHSFVD